MKRTVVIVALAAGMVAGAVPAKAAEKHWIKDKGTWISYHFVFRHPAELRGRAIVVLRARQEARARRQAVHRHRMRLRSVARLLQRAQAVLVTARITISGGVWACVARWEEGGHNSVAGYFGMIYPPASYPEPGPTYARQYGNSWLGVPYGAQLQVAQAVQQRYGWGAWGPHTRAMCGL